MKRIVLPTVLLTLTSCGMVNPDVAMRIENSTTGYEFLIGEFDGSLALIHGDPTNAKIHVTDGELSCNGVSSTGKFSTNMVTNRVSHFFNFSCNDGRTGQVPLKVSMKSDLNAHGIGIGTMNDGSKIKVVVGNSGNGLAENFNNTYAPITSTPAQNTIAVKNPQPLNELASTFPSNTTSVFFKTSKLQPDDIAVIISNADYQKGRDIPNVITAYADAASIKNYVTQALGIKEENIIHIKDAGQSELIATFGSATNPKGQLFNYVKPGKSRVFVYYSGHGAPGSEDGSSYIVPTDAQASMIDLNGYPLSTLYKNLGQIPAKSVTVVLEACFSGVSQSGSVITKASPILLKAKETAIPSNITVIAAGAANQIASWERDSSSGLFTKYFLKGMSGEADAAPYGNGDSKVEYSELGAYFQDTLTYYARRYYGRDQTAQIVEGRM
jgi:hypothetical protein